MKTQALVLQAVDAPFVLTDIELAPCQPNEVLIKMVASGICHTDLCIQNGAFPSAFPSIVGHEGSGTVVAIGKDVTRVVEGDSVLLSFAYCGKCGTCKAGQPAGCDQWLVMNFGRVRNSVVGDQGCAKAVDGTEIKGTFFGQSSFARHAVVVETSVVKVPSTTDLKLMSPLGCGLQTGAGAIFNVLKPNKDSSLVIFGAGAVGTSALWAAVTMGVSTIIMVDLVQSRLDLAKEFGATHTIHGKDPELLKKLKELGRYGTGVDYAIEATGSVGVLSSAYEAIRPYGTCVSIGTPGPGHAPPFDIHTHVCASKTYIGITEGDSNPPEFLPYLIKLYESGKFPVDRISKTFPFSKFEEAIHAMESGEVIKPIIVFED